LTGRNLRKVDGLFYPHFQKGVTKNDKTENLEQLPACTGTAQAGASGEQKEVSWRNRKKYLGTKGEETKSDTHRL